MINLEAIQGPEIIKAMSNSELESLATLIRERLICVASKIGGHLASNLGVVELTVAIHSVFNSPQDKIIWDVGHQSYAHKILTGRADKIHTVRQMGGLSGFPKREESPHDPINTGHSSTSLSSALGLAIARDMHQENHNILAVIGDGALNAGMALEALNHIGDLQKKLIIILNDNEMSIAPNVGALASYLGRLRSAPTYSKFRSDLELIIKKIPAVGNHVAKAIERVKGSLKYLFLPGIFFEELGLTYLGPVDGHNISSLRELLKRAKDMEKPTLIHVITKKGKGYLPAENQPSTFHGIGPFEVSTGLELNKGKTPTYTKVFSETLCKLAEDNPHIIGITAAMPNGTGLDKFAELFPDRFFDVGIAEQHAVTLAAGMAAAGLKPVVAIYSTFLQRAYDQILHDVCLQNLPVIFAIDRAGLVGEDGETHQGIFDISFLRHIPNLVLAAPRDGEELKLLLQYGESFPGPLALRYPRGQTPKLTITNNEAEPIFLGKSERMCQGDDLTILAIGNMVWPAYEASKLLALRGISASVIDLRFIKPLDVEAIKEEALLNKPLITIEENVVAGGIGGAVLELLAKLGLMVPVLNLGLPDEFISHGPSQEIRKIYGLTPEGIVDSIFAFLDAQQEPKSLKTRWPSREKKVRRVAGGQGAYFNKK